MSLLSSKKNENERKAGRPLTGPVSSRSTAQRESTAHFELSRFAASFALAFDTRKCASSRALASTVASATVASSCETWGVHESRVRLDVGEELLTLVRSFAALSRATSALVSISRRIGSASHASCAALLKQMRGTAFLSSCHAGGALARKGEGPRESLLARFLLLGPWRPNLPGRAFRLQSVQTLTLRSDIPGGVA